VPLTVQPDALITLPEGGAFTGNQPDHIAIEAGDYRVTGTVPNLGVPYRVLGSIYTLESSMTIAAGTRFIMSADAQLEFGWNGNSATIVAQGTAAAPIRFTGLSEVAGYWSGLIVGSNALSAGPPRFSHTRGARETLQSTHVFLLSAFRARANGN
jgi:hypothetical protein